MIFILIKFVHHRSKVKNISSRTIDIPCLLDKKTINYPAFNNFITFVILLQAAVLVLETIPELNDYYLIFEIISSMVFVFTSSKLP